MQLGNTQLNRFTLDHYASQLQQWAEALTAQANILLYGCRVAAGEWGLAFIQQLRQLTGAEIAASENLTGSAALGGDWNLTVTTGTIQTALAFPPSVMAAYESVLAVWGVQPETGEIIQIDPVTGAILNSFAAPGNLDIDDTNIGLSIAEDGNSLIYINSNDDSSTLYRLDPDTGAILSTEFTEGWNVDGLSFQSDQTTDDALIFLSHSAVDIHRQEGFGSPEDFFWAGGASVGGLGGDDTGREFGFFIDGFIREYDPFVDTSFISTLPAPAPDIEGLAFDGTHLFASTASGNLYTLDPDTGAVLNVVSVANGALFGLGAFAEPTPKNVIEGTSVSETLVGTAEDDCINGLGGHDIIAAGLGRDLIFGEDGNDEIIGDLSKGGVEGMDDTIYGGAGQDRIYGSGGNDFLYGEAGNDQLWGDDGDDQLWGGLGDDILTGGLGADTFVLAAGEGTDVIRDFQSGTDLMGLSNGLDFAQLAINQFGSQTWIINQSDNQVLALLPGVNASVLTAADFVTV